ncbi:MBG domain-containing protein [Limibacter armeniacum]|uniref:MBG domain-containing protein n=1 Tax=Limibacter armeniacum TaxID=466084 RepID=UPI002FE5FADB
MYVGNSTSPNIRVSGLSEMTQYYFKVYAYKSCGGYYWFEQTGAGGNTTTCGTPSPNTDIYVYPHLLKDTSFTFATHFGFTPNGDGHVVKINTVNSFTDLNATDSALPSANSVYSGRGEQVVLAGNNATLEVTGLSPFTTYYIKAYAYKSCGDGTYYFENTGFTTSTTTCGFDAGLASGAVFGNVTDSNLELKSFSAPTTGSVTGYIIKMNTTKSFTPISESTDPLPTASTAYAGGEQVIYAGTSTIPNLTVTGLSANSTYHFTVYGYSNCGGSNYTFYQQEGYYFVKYNGSNPEPTLVFNDLTKEYGTGSFDLSATSNSNGNITYQIVSDSGGGTSLSGTNNKTVTLGNVGSVVIEATQEPDGSYASTTKRITLTIEKQAPTINFENAVVSISESTYSLSAGSDSDGTITYSIVGANNGHSITGSTLNVTGTAGTITVRASVAAGTNHKADYAEALVTVADVTTTFIHNGVDQIYQINADGTTTSLGTLSGGDYVRAGMVKVGNKLWTVEVTHSTDYYGRIYYYDKTDGTVTVAYNFNGAQGPYPCGLTLYNGKLWGFSYFNSNNRSGIFSIDPTDNTYTYEYEIPETVVPGFTITALTVVGDALYGVSNQGGANSKGTIFKYTPATDTFEVVYNFVNTPIAEELSYINGKLWGGSYDGTNHYIYSITPGLTDIQNYTLDAACASPRLLTNVEGVVYGVASGDNGTNSYGAVFKINTDGSGFTKLKVFSDSGAEHTPDGGLLYSGGKLYGTTTKGGALGKGVFFSIDTDGSNYAVVADLPSSMSNVFIQNGKVLTDVVANVKQNAVISYSNQTMNYLDTLTFAPEYTNETVSYEIISDPNGTNSEIIGDQLIAKGAGTVTVRITAVADDVFNAGTLDFTVTINQLTPSIQVSDLAKVYRGADVSLSATSVATGAFSYQLLTNNTGSAISGNTLTLGIPGEDIIRVTQAADVNYKSTYADFRLTISEAQVSTWNTAAISKQLQDADFQLSVTEDANVAVSYEIISDNTGSIILSGNTVRLGDTDGTAQIRATVVEPYYAQKEGTIELTLTKKDPQVSWNPADIEYNTNYGADQFNAEAAVEGTFTYGYYCDYMETPLDAYCSLDDNYTETKGIGTSIGLRVIFTPADTDLYQTITIEKNIAVAPINLVLKAENVVVFSGEPEPSLTYTIQSGYLVAGDHVIYLPLTREAGTAAGTYAIIADNSSTLYCNSNVPTVYRGSLEDRYFCDPAGNYNITFIPGTYTIIDRYPVTISFNSTELNTNYDAAAHVVNIASITKDQDGSTVSPSVTVTYEGTNGTVYANSTTPPAKVGEYLVTAAVDASDPTYAGSTTAILTIAPVALTVTANNRSITYGQDVNTGNTVTFSGFVGTDTEADLGGSLAFNAIAATNVGNYEDVIIPSGLSSDNYTIGYVAGDLSITTKSITVTAEAAGKTYGEADPALTIQLTEGSLEDGDVITGNPSRVAGENVGTYAIELGTVSVGDNYTLSFVGNDFTIVKAALTIAANDYTNTYGDGITDLPFTVSYNGFVNGDSETNLDGTLTFAAIIDKNAGVQTGVIVPSGLSSNNYDITYENADLTIEKATLSVNFFPITSEYGYVYYKAEYGVDWNMTGFMYGEDTTDLETPYDYPFPKYTTAQMNNGSVMYEVGNHANGVKWIYFNTWTTNNYEMVRASGPYALTVVPHPITVTANAQTKVSGDTDPSLTYNYTLSYGPSNEHHPDASYLDVSIIPSFTGNLSWDSTNNVGVYPIDQHTLAMNSNWDVTFVSNTVTVTKKPITVTAVAQNKVYGDADPALTYSITSGSLNAGDTFTGSLSRAAGENAGTYAISQGTLSAGDNYTLTFVEADLTIGQRAIEITADVGSKTYGDADPALTYQITSGALVNSDSFAGGLSRAAGENAGTYAINLGTLSAGSNYNMSYVPSSLTIGKRSIEVTATAKSKTYGDADPSLTYQITSGALVNSDSFAGSLSRVSGENAGTYAINLGTLSAGSNYNMSYVPNNLTIGKRSIEVTATAQSKTYGDADPSLTYQITSGALVNSDSFAGSLSRVSGENAGTYAINLGTLSAGGNYNMSYVPSSLIIGKRSIEVTAVAQSKIYGDVDPSLTYQITSGALVNSDSFAGSLSRVSGENAGTYAINLGTLSAGGNYNMSYEPNSLTIGKRSIEVTAREQSKTYGDADPSLTYEVTLGTLVAGDAISGSLSRVSGENAGTYAINLGSLSAGGNYNMSYVSSSLTIGKRSIEVTAIAKNKTYGDTDPSLTYQVTSGSLVAGDALTGSLTRVVGEDVGNYTIEQGTVAVNSNYDLSFVSNQLSIGKRAIEVTANDQSKFVGATDPSLTYTITQGNLVFSDILGGELSRVTGEGIGNYAINQGTLSASSNYDLTFVPGTLTITDLIPQTITFAPLAAVTYGDSQFMLTATGGDSGNPITFTSMDNSIAQVSGTTVTILRAGTVNIKASQAGNATYAAAADVIQPLTVSKRSIEVTADAAGKTYGDTDPTFTYQVTSGSLVAGDAISGSLSRVSGENIGEYAIELGTVTAGDNYTVSFVSNDLTIGQRAIEITADAASKTYGDIDPTFTYQVTSGSLVMGDAFSGTLSRVSGEDAGTYQIGQGTVTVGANYALSFVSNDLTIGQRAIEITADAANKTYGDIDPTFTYQVTSGSLVAGDAISGTLSRVSGEDVGTYQIGQGTVNAGANYVLSFVSNDLTIGQRAIEITADASGKTYGDPDPTFTYQVTAGSLISGDSFSGTLSRVTGEDTGTYAFSQGTVTAGDNYVMTFVSDNLTIAQRAIEVTADDQLKMTGHDDPVLTYTLSSGALQFSDMLSGNLIRESGEAIGSYAINQGTVTAGANYDLTFVPGTMIITDLIPQIITFEPLADVQYGDVPFTLSATGGDSGNQVTFTSSNESVATVEGNTVTIHGVGTVNITASQSGNDTYAAALNVTRTLTVTVGSIEITADATNKTYGEADPELTYQITSGSLVEGNMLSGKLTRQAGESAGTYTIMQGTLSAGENYSISFVQSDLTIEKAVLTATAIDQNKTYGSENPFFEVTYTGFVNSDNASDIDEVPVTATVATSTSDAGTYPITVSGGSDNNYSFNYVNGTLTITKAIQNITFEPLADVRLNQETVLLNAAASSGLSVSFTVVSGPATVSDNILTLTGTGQVTVAANQSGNGNYLAAEEVEQSFIIQEPVVLAQSITFEAIPAKTYGNDAFELVAAASSGLPVTFTVADPTVATIDGNIVTIIGAGTTLITASQEGNQSYAAATPVTQELTVSKAPQAIVMEGIPDQVYGSTYPLYMLTDMGLQVNLEILSGPVEISNNELHIIGVGEVSIKATQEGNMNYFPAVEVLLNFSAVKAELTVTADDYVIKEGDAMPALTYRFNGFVNGEDASVIDVLPTATTTASEENPVPGEYLIELSGAEDDHYTFLYVDGLLTVNVITALADEILQGVQLYPVPFEKEFQLVLPRGAKGIFEMTVNGTDGREVLRKQLDASSLSHTITEMGHLPKGMYVIQLSQGDAIERYRIIKK